MSYVLSLWLLILAFLYLVTCKRVNLLKNNLFKRKEIGTENDGERGKAVKKVEVSGFGTRSPKGDQSPLRGLFGQNWSP